MKASKTAVTEDSTQYLYLPMYPSVNLHTWITSTHFPLTWP